MPISPVETRLVSSTCLSDASTKRNAMLYFAKTFRSWHPMARPTSVASRGARNAPRTVEAGRTVVCERIESAILVEHVVLLFCLATVLPLFALCTSEYAKIVFPRFTKLYLDLANMLN